MSLLVNLQELARTMDSGLEMHQLVKVRPRITIRDSSVRLRIRSIFRLNLRLFRHGTSVSLFLHYKISMGALFQKHVLKLIIAGLLIFCSFMMHSIIHPPPPPIVRCPSLPDPTNGRVNVQGNRPGNRASYTCNSGYELVGQSTRTCQNNGQWSGDAPTCESNSHTS